MFITLEGCDGAGKSTLADAIVKEIEYRFPGQDIEQIHSSQLKNDALDEYALRFEDYEPDQGMHYVVDRLHWGETIYGPLYRNQSALSEAQFRWTELYLKARGATTWHISADLETIENRLRTRGEDYLQSHHVGHVWREFQAVADRALTTGGTAMTDQATAARLATIIVNEAVYAESSALEAFRPEYIGRALPSVLLVGDAQGNSDPGVTKAPFMPRGQSCGGFLLQALPELWWHQVGIVNARETDLPDLLDCLYYPYVVALGAQASEVLNDFSIKHSVVPHPQKVRRFHNAMGDQYGALIRELSTRQDNKLSWPK
jgi:gluconate kinase